MRLKILLIVFIFLFCACHHTKYRKAQSKTSFAGSVYDVKKGDTLHSIAQKNHASVFDLMEVNGIIDSKQVQVGQRLYIPDPELVLAPVRTVNLPHKVKTPAPPDARKIDLVWPVKHGVLFRGFDTNPKNLHEGIALGAPKGTSVVASANGEVIYVGDDEARYGRIVIIKHEDPFVTIYAHLAHIDVVKGQKVKQREQIATVGNSGGVDSPRVYFQVRQHRTPVNPELYLK
ncbi:MAG: M23 family metallopeptidase [Myxococcaceae bacterium]